MNKRFLLAAISVLLTITASAQMHVNLGENSPLRKLQIAEIATANLYVDSVDENKLVEDAIRGMIEKLDPHSSYSNAKEVKAMNEPLQGNFEGIGVQFNMIDDTLMVIQPVTNGPSEKVGIFCRLVFFLYFCTKKKKEDEKDCVCSVFVAVWRDGQCPDANQHGRRQPPA